MKRDSSSSYIILALAMSIATHVVQADICQLVNAQYFPVMDIDASTYYPYGTYTLTCDFDENGYFQTSKHFLKMKCKRNDGSAEGYTTLDMKTCCHRCENSKTPESAYIVTNDNGTLVCDKPISPIPPGCPGHICVCKFPFIYGGKSFNNCTTAGADKPWCEVVKECADIRYGIPAEMVGPFKETMEKKYWSTSHCPNSTQAPVKASAKKAVKGPKLKKKVGKKVRYIWW